MPEVRLIDANALHDKVSSMGLQNGSVLGHHSGVADVIAEMIQDAPTIDPESLRSVTHLKYNASDRTMTCLNCSGETKLGEYDNPEDFRFCPYCGAKAEG